MNKKLVNIKTRRPIRLSLPVPIRGNIDNIELSEDDIFIAICSKAIVEEVLKDGSTVPLTFKNYNKNNTPVIKETKQPQEHSKLTEPVQNMHLNVMSAPAPKADDAPTEEPTLAPEPKKEVPAAEPSNEQDSFEFVETQKSTDGYTKEEEEELNKMIEEEAASKPDDSGREERTSRSNRKK